MLRPDSTGPLKGLPTRTRSNAFARGVEKKWARVKPRVVSCRETDREVEVMG